MSDNINDFSERLCNNEDYRFYSQTQVLQLYQYLIDNGINTAEFTKNPPHPSSVFSDVNEILELQ